MAGKTCQICGRPSQMWVLCKEHSEMMKAGQVVKNQDTGKWELLEETPVSNNSRENPTITINSENKSRCITCGKNTDGLLFCSSCYHKYKDKKLLFEITNCSNVELLDEEYEGKLTCEDGHIVKSKSEREIDNYLFKHEIRHAYEKKIPYGKNADESIRPDFYLPDYLGKGKDVYLEHWGYNANNIKYTNSQKYKMKIYKELCKNKELTLICTYEKSDINDLTGTLERKLKKTNITEFAINFEEN